MLRLECLLVHHNHYLPQRTLKVQPVMVQSEVQLSVRSQHRRVEIFRTTFPVRIRLWRFRGASAQSAGPTRSTAEPIRSAAHEAKGQAGGINKGRSAL